MTTTTETVETNGNDNAQLEWQLNREKWQQLLDAVEGAKRVANRGSADLQLWIAHIEAAGNISHSWSTTLHCRKKSYLSLMENKTADFFAPATFLFGTQKHLLRQSPASKRMSFFFQDMINCMASRLEKMVVSSHFWKGRPISRKR